VHSTTRRSPTALLLALGTLALFGCSDATTAPTATPTSQVLAPRFAAANSDEIYKAIAAQERHNTALLRIPGVVGTAVGLLPNGKVGVRVFVKDAEVKNVPGFVDDVAVAAEVTGLIVASSDPTLRARPSPMGFSIGHPLITAGTLGALVRNAAGQLFVMSNNHVLANQNDASIGDPMLQPGPFDGGTSADQIGTLADFQPINFSGGSNTIDVAIGSVADASLVLNSTPTDDGYGMANAKIFGDANNDRVFDDKAALLGLNVQKYGRTTKLTTGQITGINGTISVCYEVFIIFCVKSATFVDQLIIGSGTFSGGGDSGSLIVTNDANRNPVGLLFAGGQTSTIANRIDLALNRFNVSVDGTGSPPPADLTDIAITSVSAPANVTLGATAAVVVTVRNVGNQPVISPFDVTLEDKTAVTTIGTQTVQNGLAVGAAATLNFSWTVAGANGNHTLQATHTFADQNAANNTASTTSNVGTPSAAIHVGNLDGTTLVSGSTWSATVRVTVHDAGHNVLDGATVVGTWNGAGALASDTCTTGELGNTGNGTCIFLAPSLSLKTKKSVSFTVTSVTMSGKTYQSASNHDPDGSSNGTTIKVNRP
jgi:hypothetical protein